jgi:MFS family permease
VSESVTKSDVPQQVTSTWTPLREAVFRALWIAAVVSNVGTWMEDVGEAWLMTSLTTSSFLIALVETAGSLPVVFLAVPSGALADIIDRRRLLMITQAWMIAAAATLGIVTIAGLTTPWILLGLSFALGLGAAANAPAWEAITPELVSKEELPAAVTLGAVAFNLARAVGPAIGGLLVAAVGPGSVFLLNAVSFCVVLITVYRWRRTSEKSTLPPEHVIGAIRAGLRYIRHTPAIQAVLIRAALFIWCASALWALLPLVARHGLGLNAAGYGVLLGCLGLGGVTGASLLPKIKKRLSTTRLIIVATIIFAAAMLVLAFVRIKLVVGGSLFIGGIAWITLLSIFNVAAQTAVPAWVRARVLGVYMLAFFGGWAGGSALWGWIADHAGVPRTLCIAAVGLIVGLVTLLRFRVEGGEQLDLTPSFRWPEISVIPGQATTHRGPVLVTIEYQVDAQFEREFTEAAQAFGEVKKRDGAYYWNLFHDTTDPERYLETYIVDSWDEHVRQHARVTNADRELEDRVLAFHKGAAPPKISHLIGEQ